GDRLGGVRRQPARSVESAARLARGGHDAYPDALWRLRSARLGLAARADEETGGTDEIAVRTHLIEDVLWHRDREFAFERHCQLDEIERIGGQVVTQGDVGDELLDSNTKTLSDKASNMRFHDFVHNPSPSPPSDLLVLCCRAVSRTRHAHPSARHEDGSTPTDRRRRAKQPMEQPHSPSLLAAWIHQTARRPLSAIRSRAL